MTRVCELESVTVHDELEARIAGGKLELPLLPKVAGRVLAMARGGEADAAVLTRLVHQDQAMAGHMLRMANSPMYGSRTRITSLQQAIARLGLRAIVGVSLAMTMKTKFFNVPGHAALLGPMWRHSLCSATWAGAIARSIREDVETAFLCGLLNGIGEPVVLQAVSEYERRNRIVLDTLQVQELIEEFRIPAGLQMVEAWALPPVLLAVIEHREHYEAAAEDRLAVMITHCADRFALHTLHEEMVSEEDLHELPVLGELNIYADDVTTLLDDEPSVMELVQAMAV